jgi:hypothetical protein
MGLVWGRREYIRHVSGANVKERDHFSDLEVDGRIILK